MYHRPATKGEAHADETQFSRIQASFCSGRKKPRKRKDKEVCQKKNYNNQVVL